MGVALYIATERAVEGLDTFVDGKALAQCRPAGHKRGSGKASARHLETLARNAGVRPLMEFFSASPDSLSDLIGEADEELPPIELPPEQWFPASEGLETVRGLIAYLADHPDAAEEVDRMLADLRGFEEVLGRLEGAGVRWHLAVDI
jgi:hypothetical protein